MNELTSIDRLPTTLGIGWLLKILVIIGKLVYRLVRIVLWILRRIFPKR